MSVIHLKPSKEHWLRFGNTVANLEIFDPWIDIAFTQALWIMVRTTPVMDLSGSCLDAKQNATLVIMYLNALRLVLGRLLEDKEAGIFSGWSSLPIVSKFEISLLQSAFIF